MTYDQLPQNPADGVKLYCLDCGGEYSADRGDYLFNTHLTPTCCGNPLLLVQKRVRYVRVSPAKAEARP